VVFVAKAVVVALRDAPTLTALANGTRITITAELQMCRPSASVLAALAGRRYATSDPDFFAQQEEGL